MANQTIKDILIERDLMNETEAEELIQDAKVTLQAYIEQGRQEDAENICEEFFGLEPDYIVELI